MYAFQISKIETVTIPDTVTEIGHYSFCMCPNLKSVTIPSSVQKIGIRAFETCPNLTEVNLPDKIIEMNSCVFEGSPWLEEQRKKDPLVIVNGILIDGQTCKGDVVIPQSVKYVVSSAFARNNDVTSVVFPSGVTKLCDNTFFYCSNLKSVDVKSVTILDSMAFDNCDKLTDLKISNKLKSIDYYTFADIDSTCTITFYGKESEWQSVEKPENDPFLSRANVVFAEAPDDEVAGDVNMDGSFNISDLVLVQKWLIGNKSDEMKNWKAADFIADDKLDIYDLIKMRRELFK